MENIFGYIKAIVEVAIIFILVLGGKKLFELLEEEKIKGYVSWCVIQGYHYRALTLCEYMSNAQLDLGIDNEFCFCEKEWGFAEDILQNFKENLSVKYLSNSVKLPKTKKKLNDKDAFMILLYEHLRSNISESYYYGHNMHEEIVEMKTYGSRGGELYDTKYKLTDYAIVFCKLLLITYMYCGKNVCFVKDSIRFDDVDFIKEIITTGMISVSDM